MSFAAFGRRSAPSCQPPGMNHLDCAWMATWCIAALQYICVLCCALTLYVLCILMLHLTICMYCMWRWSAWTADGRSRMTPNSQRMCVMINVLNSTLTKILVVRFFFLFCDQIYHSIVLRCMSWGVFRRIWLRGWAMLMFGPITYVNALTFTWSGRDRPL